MALKTEKNATIYPVLDGVISLITYNREYGNIVIVSHGGGYHTVYANIENIIVSENDYIDQNNRIGEVSKSNISNDYFLHFQIWKNENKLDPQDWLKLIMIYNNLILNYNIFNLLIKTIESNTIPNAFLFYGNDGIGKVAHAIEFSAALLCNNPQNNTACSK